MSKLTKQRLDEIRNAEKRYQERAHAGQWMESNCDRDELLQHIDALDKKLETLTKKKHSTDARRESEVELRKLKSWS